MSEIDNLRFFIWLTLAGGIATHRTVNVYKHFGSVKNVYSAKPRQYDDVPGLSEEDKRLFYDKSLEKADSVLDICHNKGIGIITAEDICFPKRLFTVEPMPLVLYFKGNLPAQLDGFSISIVGTREPTEYGSICAKTIAAGLAKAGVIVVSGMAKGIDGIAQRAVIAAGGITVAVLGSSVDYPYPFENKDLYNSIVEKGAVISEYPPVTKPFKQNFPMRNRIVSGLTLGTVVVETKDHGGSLITARWALEQGRDVFSVPGSIIKETSKGTNALIRDGAIPVTCVEDILYEYEELYGIKTVSEEAKTELSLEETAKLTPDDRILYFLSREALHISDLTELCGIPVGEMSSKLLMLEMDNKIKAMAGGYYFVAE